MAIADSKDGLHAGQAWLDQRDAAWRKRYGQWVTPWWLVETVTEHILATLPHGAVVVDPACGDGRWLISLGRRRSDLTLVGIDIDPLAVTAARATVDHHGINATIHCGDALASSAPLPDSIDFMIGNPPFVRPQNLPSQRRKELWSRFETATDKADLYACFIERCLDLTPSTAMVLPEGWLSLHSFAALRSRILRAGVNAVYRLPKRVFHPATLLPVVLITGPEDRRVAGTLESNGEKGSIHPSGTLDIGPLAWSLDGPLPHLPGRPFGDYASIHMGVVCGDYPRYVHPGHRHTEDRPTCRGKDITRWHIRDTDEHIWYVPRQMLDRKPYVAPKHAGLFDVPTKIILAGTSGTQIRAAMDQHQRFPLDSCYVIHPRQEDIDPWGLLGLLLSPQVGEWYAARYKAARVKGVEIAKIPIPPPPWTAISAAARSQDDRALAKAVKDAYGLLV